MRDPLNLISIIRCRARAACDTIQATKIALNKQNPTRKKKKTQRTGLTLITLIADSCRYNPPQPNPLQVGTKHRKFCTTREATKPIKKIKTKKYSRGHKNQSTDSQARWITQQSQNLQLKHYLNSIQCRSNPSTQQASRR